MPSGSRSSAVILAIDTGRKKTGIAIGNKITKTARPLQTVRGNIEQQVEQVAKICREWEPSLLVVGLPDPVKAKAANRFQQKFAAALASKTEAQIAHYDENYTTMAAKSEASSNESIDALAACVLAEDWLQSNSN